jgi:predicted PurR-regulated permease PerM
MLIGFQLIGPIGIFLAIPIASAFMVVINNYAAKNN